MNILQKSAMLCVAFASTALAPPSAISFARGPARPEAVRKPAEFRRVLVGRITVIALSDGSVTVPMGTLLSIGPDRTAAALPRREEAAGYPLPVNAYLVLAGGKLVLVDAGCGTFCGPTAGRLVESLRSAGYRPEQIDEVYLTHLHVDHVGGLTREGRAVFPNAVVRTDAVEAEWWSNAANSAQTPEAAKGTFDAAKAMLEPYIAAGRFRPFAKGEPLVEGIRALAEPGHTPGHSGYVVGRGRQKLVIWGDLVHAVEVQLDDPKITIAFDSAPAQAAATRQGELRDLASTGALVAAAHVPFPGIGRVGRHGSTFAWKARR
ncbi:MBL fold metallo-hydrolase [Sphingomonas sp. RIT328]|uniref:MBL fold metallo-hydrolase n=1 Tax=Sphingomonas sp. RIT328 TaxID=1470591 RepID=UPI00044575E0|nr:MBL fold metallo-hydrolase [Sphingomonas sp. RIT328]EZP50012.1 Mpd [Sphingomonas sp. RIT328]